MYTELEVQSRTLIRALREVIGTYHNVDFTRKYVTIREPPRCLFHYRGKLQQHAAESDNNKLKSHMELCLQYVERTLHQEIKISDASLSGSSTTKLEHRNLWMVFKPGCLIYRTSKNEKIGLISRLRSVEAREMDDSYEIKSWVLNTEHVAYVRADIGFITARKTIERYDGWKSVLELDAIPLHLHPEQERIRHDLLQRGRKFLSLCGIHHCYYDGVAKMCSKISPNESSTSYTNVSITITIALSRMPDIRVIRSEIGSCLISKSLVAQYRILVTSSFQVRKSTALVRKPEPSYQTKIS